MTPIVAATLYSMLIVNITSEGIKTITMTEFPSEEACVLEAEALLNQAVLDKRFYYDITCSPILPFRL